MPIKNMNSEKSPTKLPKITKLVLMKVLLVTVFLGALASSGYFYYQYSQVKGANEIVDTKRTIDAVRKLMNLPENEVPTVATVTDKSKLKSQPFFQAAENGDKVLIYKSIKKAVLYRPSTNKIVDVAPVNTEAAEKNAQNSERSAVLGENEKRTASLTGTPTTTPDEDKIYKVALLNASGTEGATSTIEVKLKDIEGFEVTTKDNAKNEYSASTIIAMNEEASAQARKLAQALNYEVSTNMPADEEAPTGSDIVVIIGSNGL